MISKIEMSVSSLDLVNIIIITLITLFILVILRVDKILVKPKVYLKLALSMILLVLLIDELINMNFSFAVYLHPISYFIYFTIYPIIYVYSRDLVYNGQDLKRPSLIFFLIFPFFVFLLISIIFYPLSFDDKMNFVNLHLSEMNGGLPEFSTFQLLIIPAYYPNTNRNCSKQNAPLLSTTFQFGSKD
jgi:hypothetical protein